MIIVTGSIVARAGSVDELLALSLEHVRRSRTEPGCDFTAKTYIMQNSARRDLSVGAVAVHLGVSPRYLQMVFELDGGTFSAFLLNQRLTNAHRMLCAPRSSRRAVSTIAYDVGFGDLSYFNRCFRKFYGLTPRDIREAAAREPDNP